MTAFSFGTTSRALLSKVLMVTMLLWVLAAGSIAAFASYDDAKRQFDAMKPGERSAFVMFLIATGDFNGLYQQSYSERLHAAVEQFQKRNGGRPTGLLTNRERQKLIEEAGAFLSPLGFKRYEIAEVGAALEVPRAVFESEVSNPSGYSFETSNKELSLSFDFFDKYRTGFHRLYATFTDQSKGRKVTYQTIQDAYFVSSGTFRGRNYYTWMSRVEQGSVGFTLSWTREKNELASRLAVLLANVFIPTGATDQNRPIDETEPEEAAEDENVSGTGIIISENGHILTANHVIERCNVLTVRRGNSRSMPAEFVTANVENDLALLKASPSIGKRFAKFRATPIATPGEEIVVFGYPLAGALSTEGNLVPGHITARSGLANDTRVFQISAPVQPGNSGGPMLDRSGNVAGVVQSKLNAMQVAEKTGDIPQNVNFAIKSNILLDFLDWIGFAYQTAASEDQLSVAEVGEKATDFTVLVECVRH